jgi:hypothetical protein
VVKEIWNNYNKPRLFGDRISNKASVYKNVAKDIGSDYDSTLGI